MQFKINDKNHENLISKYKIENYPNPFNPTTIISYQLPENSYVSLIIYNSLGIEVKTLVSQTQSSGRYSIQFDASNLPSGLYLCRMRAGKFSNVRKMLLLK